VTPAFRTVSGSPRETDMLLVASPGSVRLNAQQALVLDWDKLRDPATLDTTAAQFAVAGWSRQTLIDAHERALADAADRYAAGPALQDAERRWITQLEIARNIAGASPFEITRDELQRIADVVHVLPDTHKTAFVRTLLQRGPNVAGEVAFQAMLTPADASVVGAWKDERHDVLGSLFAILGTQADAVRASARALNMGRALVGRSMESVGTSRAEVAAALRSKTLTGRFLDGLAMATSSPRALMTHDELLAASSFRVALRRLASTTPGDPEALIHSAPEALADEATVYGMDPLFTLQQEQELFARAEAHPAGRVTVPFLKTAWDVRRIPSPALQDDLHAGGWRREEAISKVAFASGILALTASLAAGGKITGRAPAEKYTRRAWEEAGHEAYSVKTGSTWSEYARTSPAGILLGLAADFVTLRSDMSAGEGDAVASTAVLAVTEHLARPASVRPVLSLLAGLMEGRTLDPEATKSIDRTPEKNPVVREAQEQLDAVAARSVWGDKDRAPKRNLRGDVVLRPGVTGSDGFMAPSPGQEKDRVWRWLSENKIEVAEVPPRLLQGIPLTPEQYDALARDAASELKVPVGVLADRLGVSADGQAGAWDVLTMLATSPVVAKWTPEEKKLAAERIIHAFRRIASEKLLMEYGDLRQQYAMGKMLRGEAIEPEIGRRINVESVSRVFDALLASRR
jgi:hypothetical protein